MALCAFCDFYYTDKAFYDIADKSDCSFGKYCRIISGQQQYKNKTFRDTIAELNDTIAELTTPADMPIARKMNDQDKQNLSFVISSLGYDCFDDDSWSDDDRRFAYNTLADYLTDDVLEDSHKIQSVIAMVKTYVQVEQIDKILNMELRKSKIDADQLNKLSGVKKGLLAAINAMAKENGISAITSGKKTQSGNSLTKIMKEMGEHNFEEIKVNVINSKLSESYKEVATDNIKAILAELSLTSDEYAEMLSQQTELVAKQQERIDILEEERRKLRIEIKQLNDEIGKLDARKRKK
jgi:cell division protein FtsB